VWLKPASGASDPQATLVVNDDKHEIARLAIDRSQMTAPYPTTLRLPDRALVDRSLTVTLFGNGVETRLATDGQLALKAYYGVPIAEWLDRMTVVQPWFYTAAFFQLLGGAYVASVLVLIALLGRTLAIAPDTASART